MWMKSLINARSACWRTLLYGVEILLTYWSAPCFFESVSRLFFQETLIKITWTTVLSKMLSRRTWCRPLRASASSVWLDLVSELNLSLPANQFYVNCFFEVTGFFESFGWFILIGAVVAYILYQKLKEKLASGPRSASSSQAYTRGKLPVSGLYQPMIAFETFLFQSMRMRLSKGCVESKRPD